MKPPKLKEINIIFFADASKEYGVGYKMESGILSGHKLIFENRGHDGFKLHFNIVDEMNCGFLFPDDPKDAMWVETMDPANPVCPTTPKYWNEFEAKQIIDNNNTLVVRNKNSDVQAFSFSLRFVRGTDVILYDPIGQNLNSRSPLRTLALKVVGGAIVVALVVLGLRELLSQTGAR